MSKPFLSRFAVILAVGVACSILTLPALADSQARIVRLSDVQGSVQIDKNTGLGFENAFLNLPVTQGAQVKTLDRGRAEIEFEDGSTMRLTPNTTVQFSTLGVNDSGKHFSEINLVEGMAYVNWIGKSGDQFTLNFSREKVTLDHAAHFRVDTSTTVANLAVLKGDVNVEGPAGSLMVAKKKTATFAASENDKSTLANRVEEAPLDSWDKESIAYHDQYAKNNSSPYGYGVSDLNYYGSYTSVPGYGMMWQPFFTGIGWDPFMDGAWSFYPGYGYMFVSAYPWGWMPYRYGNWLFVPGFGWMWQPGGWNSWTITPRFAGTTPPRFQGPVAPHAGTGKTIIVGKGGPVGTAPIFRSPRLTVNAGSAGLGIPRGSLGNLGHLNTQVSKNGFATVHPAPQFSTISGSTPSFSAPRGSGMSAPAAPPMGHSGSAGHASSGPHH